MHRQFSLQPFSRHYSHSTNPFLDFLELEDASVPESPSELLPSGPDTGPSNPPVISVRPADTARLRTVLSAYKAVQQAGQLHTMTFVTVNEYLWLLRAIAKELSVLGRGAMYYLAAAVSDFFLPREKMVSFSFYLRVRIWELNGGGVQSEHKIQSGKGSLVIEMDQVPKILKPMVDEWTPEGFIVSFKVGNNILHWP